MKILSRWCWGTELVVARSNLHPVSSSQERRFSAGAEVVAAARATVPGLREGVVSRSIETATAATAGFLPAPFPLPSFPYLGDGLRAPPVCLPLQSFPNLVSPLGVKGTHLLTFGARSVSTRGRGSPTLFRVRVRTTRTFVASAFLERVANAFRNRLVFVVPARGASAWPALGAALGACGTLWPRWGFTLFVSSSFLGPYFRASKRFRVRMVETSVESVLHVVLPLHGQVST